jgi:hypothetical protein
MRIVKIDITLKNAFFAICLLTTLTLQAQSATFDSDKPSVNFISSYSQTFNSWNNSLFYGQWNTVDPNIFTVTDVSSGYLQYVWPQKRIIYSKKDYTTPYALTTDIDYGTGNNTGGVVIRAVATDVVTADHIQENITNTGFNREGIAFYPTVDGASMIVQFSGVENLSNTPITQILVPKPSSVTSIKNRATLRIEDFGTSIYVYHNSIPFIRIDLSGKNGNVYSSGTVYDANMVVKGTFTGMEVKESGKVSIAQRNAPLHLYSAVIETITSAPGWDERPLTEFVGQYNQTFSGVWDNAKFTAQWNQLTPNIFSETDIAAGYLQFSWATKRMIYSKQIYTTPYTLTTELDYAAGSSRGGVVLRAVATTVTNADFIQEPPKDPGFNREGIAFYPSDDGLSMIVQFSGVENNRTNTTITKILVPKPSTVTNLRSRNTYKFEDYGSSIYVFCNSNPFIRIDLGGKSGAVYSSGTVYDASMQAMGTFTGMEVESEGKFAIAQRDATMRLYGVDVQIPAAVSPNFDNDKPQKVYNNNYTLDFLNWDNAKFYSLWDAQQPNIFSGTDITEGYLKFQWIAKRIICSKKTFPSPYILETDIDYAGGTNRGGVIIRANTTNTTDIEYLQEPNTNEPGFNREGIAFYPTNDGLSMIIQFSGSENGVKTLQQRILVPKPFLVSNLKDRGKLRIEDFGKTIYVYYNNVAYARINFNEKVGNYYTSGTVYNSKMESLGDFSGMEIELEGKVSVAQRDATVHLYNVKINSNNLLSQYIQFAPIPKKLISDAPFTIAATASSGLPVDIKYVSGPATLVGNTVTLTGQTGLVNIVGNQTGNDFYSPAAETKCSFYVGDPTLGNTTSSSQDYVDNWVVTDALNRQLPSYDEAGAKRSNKTVGVFYYVWSGYQGNKVYDITKILAANPVNPLDVSNTSWGPVNAFHFWGEPEVGYFRSEDTWVIRRDLQMLSNAHVDFIFLDVTNAITYLETVKTLCDISMQMRMEGIYTPQIVFTTYSKSGVVMNLLYDTFYSLSLFDELWFKWDGKPLIFGDFNDTALRPEVKDFFTIKYCWASTKTTTEPNHWQWLDNFPQDYGWSTDPKVPEQMTVSVAEHPGTLRGNSFHANIEPPINDNYVTEFTGQGLHFDEQWKRGLEIDPSVMMVTQWNEWIAQRFIWNSGAGTYAGKPIKDGDTYFVDAFNEEFNRDMSPMKGGHTDNHYYQLVSNIRKFKGMSAPQTFSAPVTIQIDGNFTEWNTVTPIFKDPLGDIMHRNHVSYDPAVTYINNTGRNDIIESRATYDDNTIYFYVKTYQTITSSSDPNWMLLFIDVDRNKGTGWEGYDYIVNLGVKSATETTVKQWDGSSWVNEKTIPFNVVGNEMELSIPRKAILMENTTPEFYFHWADNPQNLKDVSVFFTDGESAPDRRFNYNFSTSKVKEQTQSPFKNMQLPGVVEFEDFDFGGVGIAYADANLGNSGGAYRTDESVDIENKVGGGYNIGYINSNEWLEYTVDVKAVGNYTATIHYAATNDTTQAILYANGSDKSGVITFQSTGGQQNWTTKSIDIQLSAGKQVIRFFIPKAAGGLSLDKIDFSEKNAAYPSNGTGLLKSYWAAAVGGKPWFTDSIASVIVPKIDDSWKDISPGYGLNNDFWNIRWQGFIQPLFTETYTFYLSINDIGRVWINNVLVVDGWKAISSGKTIIGTVDLKAGEKLPIRVDFAEKMGLAFAKLEWSSPTNPREVVPQSQFFPLNTPNGIIIIQNSTFSFYPNPAKNNLNIISNNVKVESVRIIDLQGRIVYSNNENFIGNRNINLSLAKGIYFIDLKGEKPFDKQKLIIN